MYTLEPLISGTLVNYSNELCVGIQAAIDSILNNR
jgi:hypothetical protein